MNSSKRERYRRTEAGGIPPLSHLALEGEDPQAAHTLFTQLMLEQWFLANKGFYATFDHTDEYVMRYLAAVREAFCTIAS